MHRYLLLLTFVCTSAVASVVHVDYEGTLNRISYDACQKYSVSGTCSSWTHSDVISSSFYEGNKVRVGDGFKGAFDYDPDAPLTGISQDGSQAVHLNSVDNYSISSGQVSLPSEILPITGNGSYAVVNDGLFGWDSFFATGYFASTDWFAAFTFDLMDHSGGVYNDFTVPTTFNLDDFDSLYFEMSFLRQDDGDQLHLFGDMSSVYARDAAVSEPPTLSILALGFLALVTMNWRLKNRNMSGRFMTTRAT